MNDVADRLARRLCGGLVIDERVMRMGHNTVAAVRRQGRHPVLQREPSRLRVLCSGDDDQWPVTEMLKRASLRERRGQLGKFVAQAAVLTSRRERRRRMCRAGVPVVRRFDASFSSSSRGLICRSPVSSQRGPAPPHRAAAETPSGPSRVRSQDSGPPDLLYQAGRGARAPHGYSRRHIEEPQ